jgi:hypothetical protein
MLPFATDTYMRALAEANYAVAYLEWAILGDLDRLTNPPPGLNVASLSLSTLGGVAREVKAAALAATDPEERAWLNAAADALVEGVEPRNQIIHAHPATVDGEQVLHRWATATSTKQHEAKTFTEEDLTALAQLATDHVRKLSAVRPRGFGR